MTDENLLSVGIDIGTSTTHCIFSKLTFSNQASSFSAPKIRITGKEILWRAPVRLTPLLSADTVDANTLEQMIAEDYRLAGILPEQIRLGAVIITGETARKQNARSVTEALSRLAGDFVVATAGPALESILAGRGSGAAELSETTGRRVLNLDIGGGTTNMALFDHGNAIWDACLDLGGRLLRFREDDHTVLSYTPAMAAMAVDVNVSLAAGKYLTDDEIERVTRRMACLLEEAAGLREASPLLKAVTVEMETPLQSLPALPELFTFSGGVSDCIYGIDENTLAFHDLGSALGKAISASCFFKDGKTLQPAETGRATVIGAGAYSATVSGSTICYKGMSFPIRSLPAGCVSFRSEEDLMGLVASVSEQYRVFDGRCAICMKGIHAPSYRLVEDLSAVLAEAMKNQPLKVIVLEEDMAKALGQALSRRWGNDTAFLCIDGIRLDSGDTLDIGYPVADGRALPVIVKTFVFSRKTEEQSIMR